MFIFIFFFSYFIVLPVIVNKDFQYTVDVPLQCWCTDSYHAGVGKRARGKL